jgi:hypothetical protein
MYATIIIFYISLAGIVVMLLLKRREVKLGRANVVSRIGKGSDWFFHTAFSSVKRTVSCFNRKTFIMIIQLVAFHALLPIRKVYVLLKDCALSNPHSRKVIDAVRGRADIKYEGASFYLRRIGEK